MLAETDTASNGDSSESGPGCVDRQQRSPDDEDADVDEHEGRDRTKGALFDDAAVEADG